MKKRVSRDLIIFIILIPIFLWIALQLSSRFGGNLPSYSVVNKSKTGLSVFYEALKALDYPVERSLAPITEEDEAAVQIVAFGGNFDVDAAEVKDWIAKGGTLIYLDIGLLPIVDYPAEPEIRGKLYLYEHQKGRLIVNRAENLSNLELTKNTQHAYELLEVIHEYGDGKIYFNEAHLYSDTGSKTLWSAVPTELKFIFYQLIIALAAYFYYKGKAFGKPIPLYEEVERSENEYLYSASSLYRAAGAWDIMMDNYYKSFLNTINSSDDRWLEYWEREKLPSLDKAKEVYMLLKRTSGKMRAKEYIYAVSLLEKLRKIFEKRREVYWKTLKKTR